MHRSTLIAMLFLEVIICGGFYFYVDYRLDKLEQADMNIVTGINQFIQSVIPKNAPE